MASYIKSIKKNFSTTISEGEILYIAPTTYNSQIVNQILVKDFIFCSIYEADKIIVDLKVIDKNSATYHLLYKKTLNTPGIYLNTSLDDYYTANPLDLPNGRYNFIDIEEDSIYRFPTTFYSLEPEEILAINVEAPLVPPNSPNTLILSVHFNLILDTNG
jgi:hypothetical protein